MLEEVQTKCNNMDFFYVSKENAFDTICSLLRWNLPSKFSKQWLNLKIQSLIDEHTMGIKGLSNEKTIKYLNDRYWEYIVKILHDSENPLNDLNLSPELNYFFLINRR